MHQEPGSSAGGIYLPLDAGARDTLLARVSENEGSYSTLNLDYEFEGLFDEPKRHGSRRIPPRKRSTFPGFRPHPRSKFGDAPGHIGLSFGFIQFTQDGGSLGKLLSAMRAADADEFASVFGEHADELVRVTNLPGDAVLTDELAPPPAQARRSPRVAPIGGSDLWQSPWKERFIKAGQSETFRRVQRDLANDDYLTPTIERVARPYGVRSQKGLCVLLDRSVQLGVGGCAKLARRAWGERREHAEAESFTILAQVTANESWAHRVRDLVADPQLSFDLQFDT